MCKPCVPVHILNGQRPVQGDHTINATRRVDMAIGISYEHDMKKAKKVIDGVSAADRRILPDPAPVVEVSELAEQREPRGPASGHLRRLLACLF